MTVAFAATTPMTQIATALALSLVVVLAMQADMTVGEFTQFVTMMLMLLTPLKSLAEVNGPMQRGMSAAETVFGIIDAEPEVDTGSRELGRANGHLVFEQVAFQLPECGWSGARQCLARGVAGADGGAGGGLGRRQVDLREPGHALL